MNKAHFFLLKISILALSIYGFLIWFLPSVFFNDIHFWRHWAIHIFENGLGAVYLYKEPPYIMNYHPIWLYLLNIYGWIQGSVEQIETNQIYLKSIPLIFDIIGAFSIFLIVKSRNIWLPLILLLNIAYLYNTWIGAQLDSIHTTFVILAIIFGMKHNIILSLLFYLLAINTKLQAIVFLPLVGLIWLPIIFDNVKKLFIGIGLAGMLQCFILIPFIQHGTVNDLFATVIGNVDFYPVLSLHAFNMWFLIFNFEAHHISDQITYGGLTYKSWGQMLFLITSFIALFPLFVKTIKLIQRKKKFSVEHAGFICLTGALISLTFFFFNTQMHERYIHPLIIFTAFYGYLKKNYLLYILGSYAYFMTLERVLRAFNWDFYHTFVFQSDFIALIYLSVLIIGTYYLYRDYGFR